MRGPFCIYIYLFFRVVWLFCFFFFWLFLLACLIFFSLSLDFDCCSPFRYVFRFSNVPWALFTQQRGEKRRRGREIAAAGLTVYFPFNSRVFFRFFFRWFKSILLSKNNSGWEGEAVGGHIELKSYLCPEHYFIICCQMWLPLRLPDETALS